MPRGRAPEPPPPPVEAAHIWDFPAATPILVAVGAIVVAQILAYFIFQFRPRLRKTKIVKSGSGNLLLPQEVVKADKAAVATALCELVAAEAKHKILTNGKFVFGVAGGSCLDALAALPKTDPGEIDWSKATLVYVNHKCVDPNDEKATHFKAMKKFGKALGVKAVAPHPHPKSGSDGSEEAAFYQKTLKEAGVGPSVDLVILGLGGDGHVGSLHPNSTAVASKQLGIIASPKVGEPASITMSMQMLNTSGRVLVVATGADKKVAVAKALSTQKDPPGTFPAQSLLMPQFILDIAAAP